MVRISVLNDALNSIVNAERKGKRQVLIRPSSKVVIKFLSVMQKHGEYHQMLRNDILGSYVGRARTAAATIGLITNGRWVIALPSSIFKSPRDATLPVTRLLFWMHGGLCLDSMNLLGGSGGHFYSDETCVELPR
jgi:hypothetical protein